MLQKERLRKADAFMGILVFLIGGAIVLEAMSYPRGLEMSGVRNDWYVSPAFMPYIVGVGLAIMGCILFVTGLKESGGRALVRALADASRSLASIGRLSGANIRFVAVVGVIAASVFLYMPRVDFVLSSVALLAGLMSMFVFDDEALIRKLVTLWTVLAGAFFIYCVTGLHASWTAGFYFASDIVGGLVLVVYLAVAAVFVGGARRSRYFKLVAISFLVPLIIVPLFKYLLYIPLPREGGIVALMDIVRYDILDPIQE